MTTTNNNTTNNTPTINYHKQREESSTNDYIIAELRFRDIEEPFTIDNLQNMLSAIRLVNNVGGYKLPPAIKADLQISIVKFCLASITFTNHLLVISCQYFSNPS